MDMQTLASRQLGREERPPANNFLHLNSRSQKPKMKTCKASKITCQPAKWRFLRLIQLSRERQRQRQTVTETESASTEASLLLLIVMSAAH